MDQQDDTKSSDGRQDKTRAEPELKEITRISMSSWWAKDEARHEKGGRDEGLKNNDN